ncbi:uncharacterized protein Z518_01974 [Rhinocladiella mackenziei CBS 650.93]|uniref:Rhinocladiella mackenziei CBS 650.93 unplaced genomic scaffold supercont1.2, whole genome shotgun sequence n=1 Tax=Rhinocladiella mackenziei CBS 650.93 TaxID=1442369 RepID=A0A0D2IVS7_9EURO|nr:uncharacterized protein Z518_01974 [Rhinocladiella mackenziei CBS 650.93]KIX07321.1 hypothetical protein Z518_01974 [Rhinocladiella mackenziei CBS 650.93]
MQRKYSRMRETLFDLYTERDALPWYYRTIALVSSWLAAAGYIFFALTFTSSESNIKTTRTALTAVASVSLLVGYGVIAGVAFFSRSLLFVFDAVLLPILTSSFLGVFITVMNHVLHKDFPIPSQVYIYVPLVTACSTTIASAVLSYVAYRKIDKIKSLDRQRRQHVHRWERGSYVSYGDATSTTELSPMQPQLPEDEAQRRQLLRLLLTRESTESPGRSGAQNTYQITLPGEDLGHDGLPLASLGSRPRSGSFPNSSSKWNLVSRITRDRSPTVESFKNPRERRRDEIERASILLTPRTDSGWAQTPGASYQSPSSQTWGSSARYA